MPALSPAERQQRVKAARSRKRHRQARAGLTLAALGTMWAAPLIAGEVATSRRMKRTGGGGGSARPTGPKGPGGSKGGVYGRPIQSGTLAGRISWDMTPQESAEAKKKATLNQARNARHREISDTKRGVYSPKVKRSDINAIADQLNRRNGKGGMNKQAPDFYTAWLQANDLEPIGKGSPASFSDSGTWQRSKGTVGYRKPPNPKGKALKRTRVQQGTPMAKRATP